MARAAGAAGAATRGAGRNPMRRTKMGVGTKKGESAADVYSKARRNFERGGKRRDTNAFRRTFKVGRIQGKPMSLRSAGFHSDSA